jgi:hypothetical protein
MRIDTRLFAGLALLALAVFACDSREDPNLLNPPPPDSSYVRVANLVATDPIDVAFPFVPVVTALGSLQASDYHRVLIPGQTLLTVARPGRAHIDTLANQALAQGAKITYFVLGTKGTAQDTSIVLRLSIGKQEELDLGRRGERQVSFINAIPDSGSYFVKIGCQSGSSLFDNTMFAQIPYTVTLKNDEISLYLFSSLDSSRVLASARLRLTDGIHPYFATYLIAAKDGGVPKLFVLRANGDAPGPLPEAPPETRTTARVEILNGLSDATTISARIEGSSGDFATGVAPLTISPAVDVEACLDPAGDSLLISPSAIKAPLHITVGSKTLVAVYSDTGKVKTISLTRDLPLNLTDSIYIRGVNLADEFRSASVAVGAGAPAGVAVDSRPFGTLRLGAASDYVKLPAGNYPLLLANGATGQFINGGVENLTPGFYTLVIARQAGVPSIMIVRDDIDGSPLHPISSQGSRVTYFSMLTDGNATFSAGPLVLPPLAYSYVYTSIVPFNVSLISSNAGSANIDPSLGGYVIGATGTGSGKKLIAIRTPSDSIPPKSAAFRVLNAVPDGPQLAVRIGGNQAQASDTIAFGVPSPTRLIDARQYSMFITAPGDTTILARADGVELTSGRRYILVVGPKRPGASGTLAYELLWVQE